MSLIQIGPWQVTDLVCDGEFSQVFRARDAAGSIARPARYAIKCPQPQADVEIALRLLRREARVGRAVSSPHLVPILDAHVKAPPYFIVMPWIDGESLADRLRTNGRLALADTIWIARQVAEALNALDELGWTHGDIKPSNVIVAPSGHVTVCDLVMARRAADEDHSLEYTVMGTPSYMAPEVLLSTLRPDIRSDIYSLGVMIYEMLTGQLPYAAADCEGLIEMHHRGRVPDLRSFSPMVPAALARLVQSMLANEPLRRPHSPAELVQRLAALEIDELTTHFAA